MTRRSTRRPGAIVLACVAAFALSACGSGLDAPTNQIYQAAVGSDHRGHVWVLNTLFVADADGSATLSASVVNKASGAQELTGVSVVDGDGNDLEVQDSGLPGDLEVEKLQRLGIEDSPIIRVSDGATPGYQLTVTLSFSDSADVVMKAPVAERGFTYDSIADSIEGEDTDADASDDGDESAESADENASE